MTLAICVTIFVLLVLVNRTETRYSVLRVLPNHVWEEAPFSKDADTILKITVDGPIGMGNGIYKDQFFGMVTDLHNLGLKSKGLKAIILSMDSPGGAADDSDAIYRMLLETKKAFDVPVFAYVDSECASGGMLISLAADSITATSPSIIGSVGVIMGSAFNYSDIMQKVGVSSITLYEGKGKDELNPFRPWGPNEGATYQNLLKGYYNRFISLVAQHRPKLTRDKLRELGAQMFDAEAALELGYIDAINDSWVDFLASVAEKTGCFDHYQLIELVPNVSISDILNGGADVLRKGQLHHYMRLPGDLHPDAVGKPLYYRAY